MEMTPDTYPAVTDLKGPYLLGFVFTAILFGCCCVSFFDYMQYSYAADRRGIRNLVLSTGFIALATMIYLLINTIRDDCVGFGKFPDMASSRWAYGIFVPEVTAHVLVTGFFALRAWTLYGRPLYIAIPLGFSFTATVLGGLGAMVMGMTTPVELRSNLGNIFSYLWVVCQMLTDIVVTALIVVKLKESRTGWSGTDSLIRRLIVIGIECQLPPTLAAIAFLVIFLVAPQGYVGLFIGYTMLYILCLYAALNSRHHLAAHSECESSTWREDTRNRRSLPAASINVTTETYTHAQAADPSDLKRAARVRGGGGLVLDDSTESFQESKELYSSEIRLV